jgi:hypothetical protein
MHKGEMRMYGGADEVVDAYSEFLEIADDEVSALEDV